LEGNAGKADVSAGAAAQVHTQGTKMPAKFLVSHGTPQEAAHFSMGRPRAAIEGTHQETATRRIFMKRILAMTTAALMTGALTAAPALAQVSVDTGTGVTIGGGADTGAASGGVGAGVGADVKVDTNNLDASADANVDTDTTAAIGGSWDGLLSAMGDSSVSSSISSMTDVSSVNIIKIDSLADADMEALAQAKTDNQAAIDELNAAISGNAQVKAALDAQGVDTSQVVAANVEADGSLTVYVE